MSTIEQEFAETVEDERRDDLVGKLRALDAEAWQTYAASVARREPKQVRERAFDVAMKALRALSDVEGSRPWPVRTNGSH